jgi:hypothetical protein
MYKILTYCAANLFKRFCYHFCKNIPSVIFLFGKQFFCMQALIGTRYEH